jgi:ADP-ribose pyrophosphatase YjhB (NUDIX family)
MTGFTPRWLAWAREIQALAQTGFHYAENDYQRERYERLAEIAAEMISSHTELPFLLIKDLFQSQHGYATPRVDVRGAVFRDGKLLLVKERTDGGWAMPGGWADVGDLPSKSTEREVFEEAGFVVCARKVVGVYDANRSGPLELFHAFKIVFLCDLIDGEARPSAETTEVSFWGLDEIPALLSRERTNLRHIQDAFSALVDPSFQTVYD